MKFFLVFLKYNHQQFPLGRPQWPISWTSQIFDKLQNLLNYLQNCHPLYLQYIFVQPLWHTHEFENINADRQLHDIWTWIPQSMYPRRLRHYNPHHITLPPHPCSHFRPALPSVTPNQTPPPNPLRSPVTVESLCLFPLTYASCRF